MLGGGSFEDYNKVLPGFYSRTYTIGQLTNEADNGIVAGGIISDWAPDDEVFQITSKEFSEDAVSVTGYSYDHPKNTALRELFKHAKTLLAYKLNTATPAKAAGIGVAAKSGSVGNKITVSVVTNILDETKYDVSTYLDGVLKDIQTVGQKSENEVKVTKGEETPGETLETCSVSWACDTTSLVATVKDLPEGYTINMLLTEGEDDLIIPLQDGKYERVDKDGTYGVKFAKGASGGDYTIKLWASKKGKVEPNKLLSSCKATVSIVKDAIVGADGSQLKPNAFVIFDKVLMEPNAGYVFTGGRSSSSLSVNSYNNVLNALEGHSFNILFCDSADSTVKELYTAYTKRLRDTRGIYFQTVLSNYKQADYEGVVSVYNSVVPKANLSTTGLIYWTAGLLSATDLGDEASNVVYDGELTIDANISQARLELLINTGEFIFHKTGLDEISTLIDVNTFRSFTDTKGDQLANNKVVRVLDALYNRLAAAYKPLIGHISNSANGRTVVLSKALTVLDELVSAGAIAEYDPKDITIEEVPGNPNAVRIQGTIDVLDAIRQIYFTTKIQITQE